MAAGACEAALCSCVRGPAMPSSAGNTINESPGMAHALLRPDNDFHPPAKQAGVAKLELFCGLSCSYDCEFHLVTEIQLCKNI